VVSGPLVLRVLRKQERPLPNPPLQPTAEKRGG
jgi:hypothetical protein